MNNRLGGAERFWLIVFGAGIIWLAIASALSVGDLPAGDIRRTPLFLVIATGLGFVFGCLAIVSGLKGGTRGGRRR